MRDGARTHDAGQLDGRVDVDVLTTTIVAISGIRGDGCTNTSSRTATGIGGIGTGTSSRSGGRSVGAGMRRTSMPRGAAADAQTVDDLVAGLVVGEDGGGQSLLLLLLLLLLVVVIVVVVVVVVVFIKLRRW